MKIDLKRFEGVLAKPVFAGAGPSPAICGGLVAALAESASSARGY
jgi:hypothetical protein